VPSTSACNAKTLPEIQSTHRAIVILRVLKTSPPDVRLKTRRTGTSMDLSASPSDLIPIICLAVGRVFQMKLSQFLALPFRARHWKATKNGLSFGILPFRRCNHSGRWRSQCHHRCACDQIPDSAGTMPRYSGGTPGLLSAAKRSRGSSYSTTLRLVSAVASESPPTQIWYVVGSTVLLTSAL